MNAKTRIGLIRSPGLFTRTGALLAALILGVAATEPALAQVPIDLVRQAVDAMGGADALRNLKRISIKGQVRHWAPEQSYVAGGRPVFTDHSTFAMSWDLERGMARTDWDRRIRYPTVTHDVYSEIVTPSFGYAEVLRTDLVINQANLPPLGQRAMSGIRLAAHLRELERASPRLLLKALERPQNLRALPDQRLGGGRFSGAFGGVFPPRSLPAVAFADSDTTFTILFDRETHLPAAIRTLDDDWQLGDANYDLILSDWRSMGGVKIAHALSYTFDNIAIGTAAYSEVAANPEIVEATFAASDAIRQAAKPPAADAPYQWVLRRLNFNRFLDGDAISFLPGGGLRLVELAPNVQQVQGGSHNSLIVEMKDHLVVFDAPIHEGQSRFTIDAAKAKYPGKPIRYLVLTHHHNDHSGGVRTYVAEGASVIVPAPDKDFFEAVFRAPHKVSPDQLERNPRPTTIIEVAERLTLSDETGDIRLYNIPSPHALGMLVIHVTSADLMWVADQYSPGRDSMVSPGAASLYRTLIGLGVRPARFAGGHGSSATWEEFEALQRF